MFSYNLRDTDTSVVIGWSFPEGCSRRMHSMALQFFQAHVGRTIFPAHNWSTFQY